MAVPTENDNNLRTIFFTKNDYTYLWLLSLQENPEQFNQEPVLFFPLALWATLGYVLSSALVTRFAVLFTAGGEIRR